MNRKAYINVNRNGIEILIEKNDYEQLAKIFGNDACDPFWIKFTTSNMFKQWKFPTKTIVIFTRLYSNIKYVSCN